MIPNLVADIVLISANFRFLKKLVSFTNFFFLTTAYTFSNFFLTLKASHSNQKELYSLMYFAFLMFVKLANNLMD